MIHKFKNRGVLLEVRESDYVAGTIPYTVLNESGDWSAYVPKGEDQYSSIADTMACVSFSFLNVLETQIKFLTGKEVNFSDRFLAKISNTTPQGNYLGVVADAFRKYGCCPEEDWPAPPNFTWDDYYKDIPQEIKDKALKSLELYNVSYEWIETTVESLLYHLKQAPLQVVIPGHAVCGIYEQADIFKYFDSYENPFIKSHSNPPMFALKVVLTVKSNMEFKTADKDVYLIKDGKKYLIYNLAAFNAIDGDFSHVQKVTQSELDLIPDSGISLAAIVQE